jgi:hypothetical protein
MKTRERDETLVPHFRQAACPVTSAQTAIMRPADHGANGTMRAGHLLVMSEFTSWGNQVWP